MYFNLYNQTPFKNMCLTLTASDTGNTLVENNIEYKGIYKITRLENGTKEVENID